MTKNTKRPVAQDRIDDIRHLWSEHRYHTALSIVAAWPHLGEHKAAITRGVAVRRSPETYEEMGIDPAAAYEAALVAVAERYGLPGPRVCSRCTDPANIPNSTTWTCPHCNEANA